MLCGHPYWHEGPLKQVDREIMGRLLTESIKQRFTQLQGFTQIQRLQPKTFHIMHILTLTLTPAADYPYRRRLRLHLGSSGARASRPVLAVGRK